MFQSGIYPYSPDEFDQEEITAADSSDDEAVDDDGHSPLPALRRSTRQCTAAKKFTYNEVGGNPVMTAVDQFGDDHE